MIIPVRCFTCNKVIGNKWIKFQSYLESGLSKDSALEHVGLHRYCCRRMFLGHIELIDQLLLCPNNSHKTYEEKSEKK